jgi:hypothetical protein
MVELVAAASPPFTRWWQSATAIERAANDALGCSAPARGRRDRPSNGGS